MAELLWTGDAARRRAALARRSRRRSRSAAPCSACLPRRALPFDRVRLVTAALASADPFRHDLRRDAVARRGAQPPRDARRDVAGAPRGLRPRRRRRLAARLWNRVVDAARPRRAQVGLLDAALVLLADHELAGSTLAVRIAAAYRADPYGAVGAGFGVLGGALHGAASLAAEALLAEVAEHDDPRRVIERTLRRGERLPGLGHPLYPDGDPRAALLLRCCAARRPA